MGYNPTQCIEMLSAGGWVVKNKNTSADPEIEKAKIVKISVKLNFD